MAIYDITLPVQNGLVCWDDGHEGEFMHWDSKMDDGSECNVSHLHIGSHTGTHLDAPLHFIANGGTVDQLDLNVLIGKCVLLDLTSMDHANITSADLESLAIPEGTQRILFKTANTRRRLMQQPKFQRDYVALAPDAALWLVFNGVKLIGIDYLSVGSEQDGTNGETHRILLGAEVILVEGLDLTDVEPGEYQLICLPLKIAGAEGCPMRAVLISEE